jgi:nucleolar GTP-binding protein
MGFIKGQYIPNVEELIDNAFQKARSNASKIEDRNTEKLVINKEKERVKIAAEELTSKLKVIVNNFPNISELNPLYKALLKNSLDVVALRKALGHLSSSSRTIDEIKAKTLMNMAHNNRLQISKARNEFYGRIVSVVKRCKGSLNIIKNALKEIANIPKIKDLPTILLVGLPNTGKSTFLKAITEANVDIQNYSFTTKRLQVGKLKVKFLDFQILDSPGLLDRPEEKQNNIEKQTTIALKTIANSLIFILDANQDVNAQKNILKKYKPLLKNLPAIVIINKIDLLDEIELEEFNAEIKQIIKKQKIYLTCLLDSDTKLIDEIKNDIYNLNKNWYVKKGQERIK